MEDFDIFTDEINITNSLYSKILNEYTQNQPSTPHCSNYQNGRKLLAEECLAKGEETVCAFHFSEAASPALRTIAVYRDEQMKQADNKLHMVTSFIEPIQNIIDKYAIPSRDQEILNLICNGSENVKKELAVFATKDEVPLHKRYMRFSKENNVENFCKILGELPKEWTVIQLTAPYNPNENLKSLDEYRTEIDKLYLTVFCNDYIEACGFDPITVTLPANVTKEGEKPLFVELYSLLDDNFKTIENAPLLNNRRLVKNYWSRREDIDLRMKSVINVMEKEFLGGFVTLLMGKLVNSKLKQKVIQFVDKTIADWGFIKLTTKQKILLYNLIGGCHRLSSDQIKISTSRILIEHGNTEEAKAAMSKATCDDCNKDFKSLSDLCQKCLLNCFEEIHNFKLTDVVKAFCEAALEVQDGVKWNGLRKADRRPVILIVDEMLDTFPWESLPILKDQPISRMVNIHFLYSLYKLHEKNIVDGYFVAKAEVGKYVINPEKNLDRMEKRMSCFVRYWCGDWSGTIGEPPPPEDFINYLTESDIFLFCGHGDGCRLAGGNSAGAGVEGAAAKALAVLSGCGSVRVAAPAPRTASSAAHHHLHIAGSPMIVGMLWEVTDLEIDKVISTLVSLMVPSNAPISWQNVGKTKWSQGILDTNVDHKGEIKQERDLLKAMSFARESTNFVMIASSVVARGLPVLIAKT